LAGRDLNQLNRLTAQKRWTPTTAAAPAPGTTYTRIVAQRRYEISNHLGNVLATVLDRKTTTAATGTVIDANTASIFRTDIATATDYYAFGQPMPTRQYTAAFAAAYRYGFNGKENDKSFDSKTIQDYGFRLYSPALCKFLSVDPLSPKYPELTPYQFASNRPICAIDLDGLEAKDINGQSGPFISNCAIGGNSENSCLNEPYQTSGRTLLQTCYETVTKIESHHEGGYIYNTYKGDKTGDEIGTVFPETGVGQPGVAESLIPFWGNARSALDNIHNGQYLAASLAVGMVVADGFSFGSMTEFKCSSTVMMGVAESGTTPLFRAVCKEEIQDIAMRGFQPGVGYEGKLFAQSFEDAFYQGVKCYKDKTFFIVRADISESVVSKAYKVGADMGGMKNLSLHFDGSVLPELNSSIRQIFVSKH
jgi:RHS repeat-associated protein